MALKGNLRDFSLTQLLNLINLARKTGSLTLSSRQGMAKMYFKEGHMIYASRNDQDEGIATMLLRASRITKEQALTIRDRADGRSDKEIGLLLVNAGYISRRDILQSVRRHMLNVVYPLFAWEEGLFRFEPNQLPGDEYITASLELENIILEGSRRLRELEMLQDELPDLDASLKFTKPPDTSLRKVSLSAAEWRVISYINPRNSIRRIARRVGLSDFEIRKIIYGLLSAGFVELIPPPGKQKAMPSFLAQRGRAREASAPVKRGIILRLIDRIRRL